MKNWFNSLSPREQTLVSYGSIVVLFILAWLLLLKPLYNNHVKLNKTLEKQRNNIHLLQKQSVEIKQLQQQGEKPKSNSSQNSQQLIERSLQTWRLKPSLDRMQTQGANGVRLTLKKVNVDRTMRFLYELESTHGLSIDNMIINNDKEEAGFANIRLTIKRDMK